jgi:hypothetical protein
MSTVFVYHMFQRVPQSVAVESLEEHPVILSIASLRAFTSAAVVVIDKTRGNLDWGGWPARLNFHVQPDDVKHAGLSTLASKTLDIAKVWEDSGFSRLVYVDADVMWLHAPQFDQITHFSATLIYDDPKVRANSGFYWATLADESEETFRLWCDNTIKASVNATYAKSVLVDTDSQRLTDECLLTATLRTPGQAVHQQSVVALAHQYRGQAGIHILGRLTRRKRTVALQLKEMQHALKRILTADEYLRVGGTDAIGVAASRRFDETLSL